MCSMIMTGMLLVLSLGICCGMRPAKNRAVSAMRSIHVRHQSSYRLFHSSETALLKVQSDTLQSFQTHYCKQKPPSSSGDHAPTECLTLGQSKSRTTLNISLAYSKTFKKRTFLPTILKEEQKRYFQRCL